MTPQLWQPDQGLLDGVCLSAKSAASHEACRARGGAGCKAGEVCMQPVLANDECLYKVRLRHSFPHYMHPANHLDSAYISLPVLDSQAPSGFAGKCC